MKKTYKIILIIFAILLALMIATFSVYLIMTKDAKLDETNLIIGKQTVEIYADDGEMLSLEQGDNTFTPYSEIPKNLVNAFVSVEDKRFFTHNGVDFKGLFRALAVNIKSFSFKEGGSTITQQLIKNTHLSNEKTLKRKLSEIKLAIELEKKYSKEQILETYLNTLYFGDSIYGVTQASYGFYNKKPQELTLTECAGLAGMVKAPNRYSPIKDCQKYTERRNAVLYLMREQGYISEAEYSSAITVTDKVSNKREFEYYNHIDVINEKLSEILESSPYGHKKLKVKTTIDKEIQDKILSTIKEDKVNANKSIIVMNKNGEINGYISTKKEDSRQLGSIVKPLLVYAPAIEENKVYSCTKILDEKVDFNGYSPSNYNDVYYGYVSVKTSLAKSLNSCSIKLLNQTGIKKCVEYAKSLGLEYTEKDENLSIALGGSINGHKFTDIVGAYSVFLNDGYYVAPTLIKTITDEKGRVLFKADKTERKIFSSDTTAIMNDMMRECVEDGTAKKLSFSDYKLCAKTGTVGNDKGNTDAYSVSFNPSLIIGVHYFSKTNLLPNAITGGSNPTKTASLLWSKIKTENKEFKIKDKTVSLDISLPIYEEKNTVVLADKNAEKRYVKSEIFRLNYYPKTMDDSFTSPKTTNLKTSVNNGCFSVSLCVPQYIRCKVISESKGELYDITPFKNGTVTFTVTDKQLKQGENSIYILPYYKKGKKYFYGEKVFLPKIKSPIFDFGDDWINDL